MGHHEARNAPSAMLTIHFAECVPPQNKNGPVLRLGLLSSPCRDGLEEAKRVGAGADQQVLGLLVVVEHHLGRLASSGDDYPCRCAGAGFGGALDGVPGGSLGADDRIHGDGHERVCDAVPVG